MATVTKDFRVKNGLIVEGTTGTINGSNILTTANDTGDISEGTNLYFTDARAKTSAASLLTNATLSNITISGDGDGLVITAENGVADSTTTDLTEGTNLYFTDQRAIDAIEGAASITLTGGLTLSGNPSANLEAATKQYVDAAVSTGVGDIDSDDVPEGATNLYFTTERAQDAIASAIAAGTQTNITVTYDDNANSISFVAENGVGDSDTDDLEEGTTNLYFTDARAQAAVAQDIADAVNALDTDDIEEGATNLYFTDNRVRSAVSAGTGITYNSGTGEFSIDDSVVVTENDLDVHTNATSGVHGVTGDVVGTTDTQTISNKTLGSDLNANSNKITNLSTPTAGSDAANKTYVDEVAQGIHALPAAEALADSNIAGTFSSVANTITSVANETFPVVDGVALAEGDNILLIGQTNAWENGSYVLTEAGEAGVSPWVLTRCDFCNETEEVAGGFEFVTGGTTYGNTGWVATVPDGFTLNATDGSGDITWVQFSGAGTYTAGTNLTLNGTEFVLNDSITLSSVTADLTGNVSGDVTGNLTGDVTGTVSDISNHDTDDLGEGSTNLYFTDQRAVDALEAVVPNFTEVDVNSLAKQVAATTDLSDTNQTAVYSFDSGSYRSAKFVVKAAYGVHTEVSEILVTLDTSDNIAITEYAVVATNGSLIDVTAGMNGTDVEILATAGTSNTDVTVVGTLIA